MLAVGSAALFIFITGWIIKVLRAAHDFDESMRMAMLRDEARKKNPNCSLIAALSLLRRDKYDEIMNTATSAEKVSDLMRDYLILNDEINRLAELMSDQTSSFRKTGTFAV